MQVFLVKILTHCYTIQWSLYYNTMVTVLQYNGHCITIQWSLLYNTMVDVMYTPLRMKLCIN